MSNIRLKALEIALTRRKKEVLSPNGKISDYFGSQTFNHYVMQQFLPQEVYRKVLNSIETGIKIDRYVADQVAASLKAWAMSKGATHFTHWFHPLTGSTAEKHDTFTDPVEGGLALETFKGSDLVQQEPDASSFPSGGIRNTFEARGYTAWDPTSAVFILDNTLCIPTVFVSYTGEALDYKTPLIRTMHALDRAATEVCRYFDKNTKKVIVTLGWEQEYFLVDSALFRARPDLALTGRTLFGHSSAKDQQLSDHYFGTIPERVLDFMRNFEQEAYKLGIPVKTRHNEVAPGQFECAPVYEEVNQAVDHNQLLMHLMERVARWHDFNVLFHEKPYAGINGSGKHNNWSLMTDKGENLLSPGKTAKSNFRFIVFLVNVIKAVDNHPELLNAYIASAGNDLRLGGHEAPPAIISVFIGSQLTQMLDDIENLKKNGKINNGKEFNINLNLPKIPEILLDNTDRNRTSPFAFTGNKFEFRAVGASSNCARAMIPLNLLVTDQLCQFKKDVDILTTNGLSKDNALMSVIKQYIAESKRIRFEGNNYSDEWKQEAVKRGLKNMQNTPAALEAFIKPDIIELYARNKILSERELIARYEIKLEHYTKKVQIESRVLGDLASNHIIPTAIRYQNTLIENVKGLKEVLDSENFGKLSHIQIQTIIEISSHINGIKTNVALMLEERKKANRINNSQEKATTYAQNVLPFFGIIRQHVDKLELLVDDELWPLPKYRELLFIR
ncbi:MAG: glutamine synthetase III [Bacteroidales bacterium]|nr:glutamine synthetase III [Bacteroidales bacterium]